MLPKKLTKNTNNNNNKLAPKKIQKQPLKRPREPQGETPGESSKPRGSLGRMTDVEPNIPKGMLNFVI